MARKTWASGDVLTASDLNTLVVQAAPGSSRTIHIGTTSGTTDASGNATVTHGAGFTPTVVVALQGVGTIGGGQQNGCLGVSALSATTFTARFGLSSAAGYTLMYMCVA